MEIDFFEQMCYNLITNGGYNMKYKFRLSYKEGNKYIPIDLNNVVFLNNIDRTEIKTIDEFTTYFETKEEMGKTEAINSGAECMFIEKYPDTVTVYSIGEISKELCGGPHVDSTGCLGTFKIKKEEASSAGVRRIKAVLE